MTCVKGTDGCEREHLRFTTYDDETGDTGTRFSGPCIVPEDYEPSRPHFDTSYAGAGYRWSAETGPDWSAVETIGGAFHATWHTNEADRHPRHPFGWVMLEGEDKTWVVPADWLLRQQHPDLLRPAEIVPPEAGPRVMCIGCGAVQPQPSSETADGIEREAWTIQDAAGRLRELDVGLITAVDVLAKVHTSLLHAATRVRPCAKCGDTTRPIEESRG